MDIRNVASRRMREDAIGGGWRQRNAVWCGARSASHGINACAWWGAGVRVRRSARRAEGVCAMVCSNHEPCSIQEELGSFERLRAPCLQVHAVVR